MLNPWYLWRASRRESAPLDDVGRQAKLIVVVEGVHDVEFLRRISHILHADDRDLPDLAAMEVARELIFVPFGGGDVLSWSHRLAALGLPEVHLYDHETMPETAVRDAAAAVVNRRPNCRAYVTRKRSLENYLSPVTLRECRGLELSFSDMEDVAELVAKEIGGRDISRPPWSELSRRARRRFRERAKTWLNRDAVSRMTPQRLAERDPGGEVTSWLRTIADLSRRR